MESEFKKIFWMLRKIQKTHANYGPLEQGDWENMACGVARAFAETKVWRVKERPETMDLASVKQRLYPEATIGVIK